MGLDAGPKSRQLFKETVLEAKTILWNGCFAFSLMTSSQANTYSTDLPVFSNSPPSQPALRPSSTLLLRLNKKVPQSLLEAVIQPLSSLSMGRKLSWRMLVRVEAPVWSCWRARFFQVSMN